MDYILRSGAEEAASPYSNVGDQYYAPTTSDVVSAFTEEAFKGIGTGYADLTALEASKQQRQGVPLSEEDYRASPFFRSGIPYSRDLTNESARVLAEYNDDREKNAFIINHASTAQKALGYTTSFATGIFEPKNIATGVAASAVLSPIAGGLAPAASSLKRIIQLKKSLGRYGDKALLGGVEGMVAAAAAEPSNQYSAGILKQDYTMADTLWNVGLSATFGAGFNTVPSMVKERWQRYGNKAPDIAIAELDTATAQLSQGKRVDVSPIERTSLGSLSNKPIAERASIAEQFVRYTETPEFKARFEGSKVLDDAGAPLRVYHGTTHNIETFDFRFTGRGNDQLGSGFYFTNSPHDASSYAAPSITARVPSGESPNVIPAYLSIKKPLDINEIGSLNKGQIREFINMAPDKSAGLENWAENQAQAMKLAEDAYSFSDDKILDRLHSIANDFYGNDTKAFNEAVTKILGYDGIVSRNGDVQHYVSFSPDQIIPAFGADDLPAITKRLETENQVLANKAMLDDVDPNNDTALDIDAARDLDTFDSALSEEEKAIAENYKKSLEEISFMKREGLMTDAEIEMFTDAINSVNAKDIEAAYDSLLTCLTRG